jgi:hypothetical protein
MNGSRGGFARHAAASTSDSFAIALVREHPASSSLFPAASQLQDSSPASRPVASRCPPGPGEAQMADRIVKRLVEEIDDEDERAP